MAKEKIRKAIGILKDGGIVIYPTDTAYGIGCKVSDAKAVEKLFALRKRPETKAVPVLISSLAMAKHYTKSIDDEVKNKLIEPYWPGALTIVMQSRIENVPALVRGQGDTVGLRMPKHPDTLAIIEGLGEGIVGCSANFAGEATPYTFDALDSELVKLVDYVVPGECLVKQASTVIDATVNPWKIVREGAIQIKS